MKWCAGNECAGRRSTLNPIFLDGGFLMRTWLASAWSLGCRYAKGSAAAAFLTLVTGAAAAAQEAGGEAALKVPDL